MNEGVRYHARCADNIWHVDAQECAPRPLCGSGAAAAACGTDEVCVYEFHPDAQPVCRKNPCTVGQLSCSCAQSLCSFGYCSITPDSAVACVPAQ